MLLMLYRKSGQFRWRWPVATRSIPPSAPYPVTGESGGHGKDSDAQARRDVSGRTTGPFLVLTNGCGVQLAPVIFIIPKLLAAVAATPGRRVLVVMPSERAAR